MVFAEKYIEKELLNLGITRKIVKYWSHHRDEQQRINYWTNPPFAGNGPNVVRNVHGEPHVAGVLGVDEVLMVDIDEASFYPQDSQRKYGYAARGCEAIQKGYGPRDGGKVTIIMAVDINVGCVARWSFVGNTDRCTFYTFLQLYLFPKIYGQRRCILMDNLAAHFGPSIDNLFAQHGHYYVRRPVHSPDFGPVEWGFNWILMYLRHHNGSIDQNNLVDYVNHGADALTGDLVAGFFVDAGYYVSHVYPQYDFHPCGI